MDNFDLWVRSRPRPPRARGKRLVNLGPTDQNTARNEGGPALSPEPVICSSFSSDRATTGILHDIYPLAPIRTTNLGWGATCARSVLM